MSPAPEAATDGPLVGLFVTCLVDLFRPSVAFAAIKLLEAGGARVEVPRAQACCGQPAYNSGDRDDAVAIARQVIEAFEPFDYVVAPSGSCTGMLKVHYPRLLADDPRFAERAKTLAAKSYELTSFLVDVLGLSEVEASYGEPSPITIHARPRASFTSGMHPGDCWQASPGLPSSSFPRARYVAGSVAHSR